MYLYVWRGTSHWFFLDYHFVTDSAELGIDVTGIHDYGHSAKNAT